MFKVPKVEGLALEIRDDKLVSCVVFAACIVESLAVSTEWAGIVFGYISFVDFKNTCVLKLFPLLTQFFSIVQSYEIC